MSSATSFSAISKSSARLSDSGKAESASPKLCYFNWAYATVHTLFYARLLLLDFLFSGTSAKCLSFVDIPNIPAADLHKAKPSGEPRIRPPCQCARVDGARDETPGVCQYIPVFVRHHFFFDAL